MKKPILNAYGALRSAAKRPGAPLCGNRVWTKGTGINIQRGTTTETLATAFPAADTIRSVEVQHGGRLIEYEAHGNQFGRKLGTLIYQNGAWISSPSSPPLSPHSSGTWLSMRGTSHDQDSTIIVTPRSGGSPADPYHRIDVDVVRLGSPPSFARVEVTIPANGYYLPPDFTEPYPTNDVRGITIAFPTNGDTALMASSMYHSYLAFLTDGTASVWPETARLYRILMKTSPPTVQFVGEVRDSVVFWIGLSEDGREKVMAAGRDSVVFGASGTRHVIQKCSVRWSRPNFSALPGQQFDDSTSARFVVQAQPSSPSPAQGCDIANEDGAGTIAPRIAGRSHATMTAPLGPTRFTKSRRGTPALQPR